MTAPSSRSMVSVLPQPRAGKRSESRRSKGTASVTAGNLKADIELFTALFTQFILAKNRHLGGSIEEEDDAEEADRRSFTPRSAEPLSQYEPRPLLKSRIKRLTLHFSCPACHRRVAVHKNHAGKKARCPLCFNALKVPDPKRQHRAHNLERDIETILRPESFIPTKTAQEIRQRGVCRSQAMTLAAMALGMIVMVTLGFARIIKNNVSLHQSAANLAAMQSVSSANNPLQPFTPTENRARAQQIVEKFLTADGWKEKSQLVRDPERVGPLMKEFYEQHGGSESTGWKSISTSGLGYYEGCEMNQAITHVSVVDGRGEKTVFTVEHGKVRDCIEWESSIAATSTDWNSILKSDQATRHTIAVLAAKDDYYNFGYSDLTHDLCIRLQDPKTNELLSYGYLVRGSADFDRALAALHNATPEHPQPLLLEIQTDRNTAKNRQLRVTRVVNSGWRNAEGLASIQ